MDTFDDILKDVRELLLRETHPRKRTMAVSPEVAGLLEAMDAQETVPELLELEQLVSGCTKCGLCQGRRQTVFGAGNPRARLVFVGEAPGESEDRQGKPFVGRAGQLLTDIIVKGFGLTREEVYICNVVKCRPPENRNPAPDEVAQCEPYLIRQLELIRPEMIVALGGVAAQCLLKTTESVGRLRGFWHQYQGIPLRVTYHPAYLLRNPVDKKKTWEDVKAVLRVYRGEEPPPARTSDVRS
ncbi:MAG: uracil-DNA glycosylase [FCB group bacterium]|nr:uracil-DNA glycosylase [FCB group bacterium]